MRAANALRGPPPPALAAPRVFEATARAALRLYCTTKEEEEEEEEGGGRGPGPKGWAAWWGPFVHKACKMGQADAVARAWVAASSNSSGVNLAPLVECLPLPALEPFLVAVVRALLPTDTEAQQQQQEQEQQQLLQQQQEQRALDRGFGELQRDSGSAQGRALHALLVSKLLVTGGGGMGAGASSSPSKRRLPRRAAPLLVRLAAEMAGGGDGVPSVLLAVARAWKERRFVRAADAAQQEFVTHALVAGLGMLTREGGGGAKALEVGWFDVVG